MGGWLQLVPRFALQLLGWAVALAMGTPAVGQAPWRLAEGEVEVARGPGALGLLLAPGPRFVGAIVQGFADDAEERFWVGHGVRKGHALLGVQSEAVVAEARAGGAGGRVGR